MAYLTFLGATGGPPTENSIKAPALVVAQGKAAVSQFYLGRSVVSQAACEACHKIGDNGNDGPGPELTQIGSRLPAQAIARTLVNPTQPMPSYGGKGGLPPKQFSAVVAFLSDLK
jgi:cytochrome c5